MYIREARVEGMVAGMQHGRGLCILQGHGECHWRMLQGHNGQAQPEGGGLGGCARSDERDARGVYTLSDVPWVRWVQRAAGRRRSGDEDTKRTTAR